MKMSHLLGERFKETPSDCQIASHALMMRGGYMRQLCNGIYSLYPPARRITRKIEQISERRWMRSVGRRCCSPLSCQLPYGGNPAVMRASAAKWPVSRIAAGAMLCLA